MRSRLFLWLAFPLLLGNAAAPPRPTEVGALSGGKTALTVSSGTLHIDCQADFEPCQLEVTYEITNPSDTPVDGVAAFYGLDTTGMTVTVDGVTVDTSVPNPAAYDAAVRAESSSDTRAVLDSSHVGRQGFALAVAPHATVHAVIRGALRPMRDRGYDGYALPADRARHPMFTPEAPHSTLVRLAYLVSPIRTWAAFPATMAFTLTHPARWTANTWGVEQLATRTDGARTTVTGVMPTSIDTLSVDLASNAGNQRLRGGIFLALGGMVDDATGVRVRGGVELAWRRSRLISLAVEHEPDSTIIVPAFSMATPWILIFPSLGAGLGVPMRLSPSFEVGVRAQLDAHLGPLGFFVAFDTYPGMDAGPRRFETILMGQIGL